ncbi:hypothetical protein [Singulisphaera acidiphila]|uniref:hypothetical protein n=1 Tax=Singulisphaera acidiphila TaxID=466153 RepID=UPI00024714F9|nr:hypothetical protein [Singulisphaera acidiphila]
MRASVNDVILAYWKYAEGYYRRADGSNTEEVEQIRLALRPLRRLYGHTLAQDFSPKSLKLVRQSMIDSRLGRRTINQHIGRPAIAPKEIPRLRRITKKRIISQS